MSGPYQVVSYEPGLQIDDPGWVVLNGEKVPIAITETESIADMLQDQLQTLELVDEVESEDKEDCESSIRVMSAAPCMLDALDNILNLKPDYTDPESYVREVRLLAVDAVRKATLGEADAGGGQAETE